MNREKGQTRVSTAEMLKLIVEEVDEAREVQELVEQFHHALPLRSFDDAIKAVGQRGMIKFRGNAFDIRQFGALVPAILFPIDDAQKLVTLLYEVVRRAPKTIQYNETDPAAAKRHLRRLGILGAPVGVLGSLGPKNLQPRSPAAVVLPQHRAEAAKGE